VIVYGDTNTTLAGALSASKLHIPVAHVEAGLRSFNKRMPEEINRVVADHVSDLLFAPTETAVSNLAAEGIRKGVYNVGDVMFDVALQVKKQIGEIEKKILDGYGLQKKEYILVTIHRADNTDIKNNLKNIWDAVNHLAGKGIKIFFPVHPRTKKYLSEYQLIKNINANLIIAEPVSYSDMIILESNAKVIITDSGGVQKESYFFKTPAVIPRDETEWVEIAEAGWSILAGADRDRIVDAVTKFYNSEGIDKMWISFYGEGDAAVKIVDILKNN